MDGILYRNFDLLIQRAGTGYRAQVVDSPAGQGSLSFTLPFSDLELENLLLRIGQRKRGMRRAGSPEMEIVREFGGRLFETIFAGEIRECLRGSLDETDHPGSGLRIRLRLSDVPELADLPWEYLYSASRNRFLALSVETPLVRYPHLQERIDRLAVKFPLKVLVMISSPTDYPQLDVGQEWTNLRTALGDLERRGLVKVDRLDRATLEALSQRLDRGGHNVLHFIGHGTFEAKEQDGVLILEDEHQRGVRVSGRKLGMLLYDHRRSLRLALLNACEGARVGRNDPFSGTAQSLVQQGIPAVIAMQFEISDEAAITFSGAFYAALAEGQSIDTALANGRKIIFARGNEVEWGTPVLYLRSPDGQIFDVQRDLTAVAEAQSGTSAETDLRPNSRQIPPTQRDKTPFEKPGRLKSSSEESTEPAPEIPNASKRGPRGTLKKLRPAAAGLLLMMGAGLWYWDAYYRPHHEYYARVIKRWGLPEGVGALTDEQVRHRNASLEFVKRGRRGPFLELRVVNSHGEYPPVFAYSGVFALSDLNPLEKETLEGGVSMPSAFATRRVVFERGTDGRVQSQRAYNAAGRLLYALQYVEPDIAKFGAGVWAEAVSESGITHIKFVRPDNGQEKGLDQAVFFLDDSGKPQPDRAGSYGVRYVFNSAGLPVESIKLDASGQPATDRSGVAKVRTTFDAFGDIVREVTLGADGQPVLGSDTGFATVAMSYDPYGNRREMAFLDIEGRLVTHRDLGAAAMTTAYDTRGNIVENTFRDINRHLVTGPWGFAKQKVQWNDRSQSWESFFGVDGKPVLMQGRYIKMGDVWDKRGYPVETTYFDENDQPVRAGNGCTKMKFVYDEHGNQTEIACFDEGNLPVRTLDGWAKIKLLYDERGNATEKTFFGPKGEPELYGERFVKAVLKYNDQGKQNEEAYFDTANHAVKNKDGYAKVTYNHDTRGELIEVSFFDEQGQPTARKGGYAHIVRAYDPRGHLSEETLLDIHGKPARHEDGYSRVKFAYDDRGYRIEQRFFDENGRPILIKDGYARERFKYNDEGKKVESALFGLNGDPVVSKKGGYAKLRWTYDERGNVSQTTTFGPKDQLLQTPYGYATVRYSYDALGRQIGQKFFDGSNSPVYARVAVDKPEPGSKGERIGLQSGDLILSYDGQDVIDTHMYQELELVKGERPRELRIQRDGKILSFDIDPGRLEVDVFAKVAPKPKKTDGPKG